MGLLTLKQSTLAYRLDFAIYGVGIAALAGTLLVAAPRTDALALALCSVGGLAGWSALEYVIHRFVLHGLQPFRRWHAAHHRHPGELICSPTVFSASLILALVFLPALAVAGAWRGCAVTLGVLVGYFGYSLMHHAMHHWRAEGAGSWLGRRKLWHAQHHRDPVRGRCYGVTSGLWDTLLGTGARRRGTSGAESPVRTPSVSPPAPTSRPDTERP
ncbi:MAG: sterol desaturase family protein [Caulobacter sp.]|nr:sterol desaturase family protein [Vitreoscilla sp.]